ncbi:MAG TPA: DNA mismatch repair protein MutS [Ktedonobacterales bacterium]
MSTPARRQYLDIKARHQGAILLYQVGDFYETFDDDARIAARELQLVLTSRAYGPGERVPLAGVPLHALETYAARLVARGYTVAICEQVSPPGRGLVQREVTRILTPGTLSDPAMLHAARDNYLAAVASGRNAIGLAYVDVNSGAFACTEWHNPDPAALDDALRAELTRLAPAELLVSAAARGTENAESAETTRSSRRRQREVTAEDAEDAEEERVGTAFFVSPSATVTPCPAHYFAAATARERLCRHLGVASLAGFGCAALPLATAAAGAILAYVTRMNPALARLLTDLRTYDTGAYVELDGRTWRALEVIESAAPHASRGVVATPASPAGSGGGDLSLLAVLNATRTAPGARLLRRQLLQPLKDREALEARLDAVSELHDRAPLRERVAAALDGLGDLERLTARVVHGTALPRELRALAAALVRAAELRTALRDATAPALGALRDQIDPCDDVRELILRAVEDPDAGSGRMLCQGYDAGLDEQHAAIAGTRAWIAGLEAVERERTGIKSLKVGYNQVFGYYLEVTKSWLARVPDDYQRRQTIAGGERYVTAELKENEARVLAAQERIAALERTLYDALLADLAAHQRRLRATAGALAQADVGCSLALVARSRGYVRPELTDTTELEIRGGRHPIVEAALDGAEFVPNDTRLDALRTWERDGHRGVRGGDAENAEKERAERTIAEDAEVADDAEDAEGIRGVRPLPAQDAGEGAQGTRLLLLTGPNMAGKSTYLRQIALIVLLAQIGSFVPADYARIGLVDRIFARVGAQDDLARGLSTFMMEMVETAYILRHATPRSLIILDEVGRGTSTRDGLAIARAVLEHLHDTCAARTLFATHFHELAAEATSLPWLRACRMAVAERDGEVVFLHRVAPGAADESYGVRVARMAGLPSTVVARAAGLLVERAPTPQLQPQPQHANGKIHDQRAAYTAETEPAASPGNDVTLALAGLNIAAMTPIEAINVLFSLQQHALAVLRRGAP